MSAILKLKALAASAVVAGAVLLGTSASAVTVPCSNNDPDVTNLVTGTSACHQSSDTSFNNDSTSGVNSEKFFGFDDWMFVGKDNGPDGTTDEGGGLTITSNGSDALPIAGNWGISGYDAGNLYMLIFKGGTQALPEAVVAYLANGPSGTYKTPLFDIRNNCIFTDTSNANDPCYKPKNVSHISLYKRVAAIPVPAAGFFLIGAMGGLFAIRRRRRSV